MTVPATGSTNCPNCGAAIRFLWAQAVQSTCNYCHSVLVRQGLDLTKVGTQAEFPATGSPIQVGVEGTWRGKSFLVVGRIAYAWKHGRWNEWHCRLNDGTSAWLSDAQLEYAMSTLFDPGAPLPAASALQVGQSFMWGDRTYTVSTRTPAIYVGTEGDLPFTSYDKSSCWFVDLQNAEGGLATVDDSESPPLLFVGEYVSFDDLKMRGLREFEGW